MSEHRLIYADELIKVFEQYLDKIGYEGESISKSARTSLMKWVIYKMNEQPTAYDIDKAVKELEEELKLADAEKIRCSRENPLQFDSAKGYAMGIYNAIEIVKGGAE